MCRLLISNSSILHRSSAETLIFCSWYSATVVHSWSRSAVGSCGSSSSLIWSRSVLLEVCQSLTAFSLAISVRGLSRIESASLSTPVFWARRAVRLAFNCSMVVFECACPVFFSSTCQFGMFPHGISGSLSKHVETNPCITRRFPAESLRKFRQPSVTAMCFGC